jgi:hypothetical protein
MLCPLVPVAGIQRKDAVYPVSSGTGFFSLTSKEKYERMTLINE